MVCIFSDDDYGCGGGCGCVWCVWNVWWRGIHGSYDSFVYFGFRHMDSNVVYNQDVYQSAQIPFHLHTGGKTECDVILCFLRVYYVLLRHSYDNI
jgi:hypothetical protein